MSSASIYGYNSTTPAPWKGLLRGAFRYFLLASELAGQWLMLIPSFYFYVDVPPSDFVYVHTYIPKCVYTDCVTRVTWRPLKFTAFICMYVDKPYVWRLVASFHESRCIECNFRTNILCVRARLPIASMLLYTILSARYSKYERNTFRLNVSPLIHTLRIRGTIISNVRNHTVNAINKAAYIVS